MQLTLLVPGLTWLEKENIRPIFKHISLPGLDQITQHAKTIKNNDQQLGSLYQYHLSSYKPQTIWPKHTPRLAAGDYLLVSPVQLTIHSNIMTLQAPDKLNISELEAQQICNSINTLIMDDNWHITPITPTLWQITIPQLLDISLTPLWDAVGFLNPEMLAQGKDRNQIEKISAEIQILLNTHSINQRRAEQNAPTINAVWFWSLPSCNLNETDTSYNDVYAWQQASGAIKAPFSYSKWQPEREQDQHPLSALQSKQALVLNELLYANKTQDLDNYLNILVDLDQRYFLPLWHAIKTGSIKKLTLVSHGCNGGQIILKPTYTRFFWHKPKKFNGTFNT